AAVVHQEAAGAGELIVLLRQHPDGQLLTGHAGQVRARQLERLGQFGLVHIDRSGLSLRTASLQFFEGILVQFVNVSTAGGVVVGSHLVVTPRSVARSRTCLGSATAGGRRLLLSDSGGPNRIAFCQPSNDRARLTIPGPYLARLTPAHRTRRRGG